MELKGKNLLRDQDIRLSLVEYLAKSFGGAEHFIALEARYSENERRADVLAVSKEMHAYEIKSDVDKLDRLEDQVADYRATFDFVTVVTTPRHIGSVRKIVSPYVGLLMVSQGLVKSVRKPKRNKRILKRNLISICAKGALLELAGQSFQSTSIADLKKVVERDVPYENVRTAAHEELCRRFRERYADFQEEARHPFRHVDLSLLSATESIQANLLMA